jgi:hypothetical protein
LNCQLNAPFNKDLLTVNIRAQTDVLTDDQTEDLEALANAGTVTTLNAQTDAHQEIALIVEMNLQKAAVISEAHAVMNRQKVAVISNDLAEKTHPKGVAISGAHVVMITKNQSGNDILADENKYEQHCHI